MSIVTYCDYCDAFMDGPFSGRHAPDCQFVAAETEAKLRITGEHFPHGFTLAVRSNGGEFHFMVLPDNNLRFLGTTTS